MDSVIHHWRNHQPSRYVCWLSLLFWVMKCQIFVKKYHPTLRSDSALRKFIFFFCCFCILVLHLGTQRQLISPWDTLRPSLESQPLFIISLFIYGRDIPSYIHSTTRDIKLFVPIENKVLMEGRPQLCDWVSIYIIAPDNSPTSIFLSSMRQ